MAVTQATETTMATETTIATETTMATETTAATAATVVIIPITTTDLMEGTGHTTDMDIMVENTKVNTVLRMKNKQQNCKKGVQVPCITLTDPRGSQVVKNQYLGKLRVSIFAHLSCIAKR